jgi:regulator of protease activity HflC (stomatin/prohibitin superfamily)
LITANLTFLKESNMDSKLMFRLIVGGAYAVLLLISVILSNHSSVVFSSDWNWGLALFLMIVLYTIASFRQLGPTELGARVLFGKPIDQVSSGFVFVPVGIFTLEVAPATVIQDELPSDPQNIFRGDGEVPPGKFPPIRIPFGLPTTENDDPYDHRMTQEVVPVVTWRIENFIKFLTTIGSVNEARRQMEDTAIAMLIEAFAKITPAVALQELEKHSNDLKRSIDDRVEGWGIELKSAKIKGINFDHALNTAILGVPKATVNAKATVITAEARKRQLELEGAGAGNAEKAILDGRTAGLKKMATELGIDGKAVLAAETARGITSNPGQKTIIAGSGGFSDLAIVGAVLGETLQKKEA